jgi:hypothetical protein
VVRNGLSDGHGLPASTVAIGTPTQMPVHSSTAGSGEISPATNPVTIAPYHQARPRSRRPVRAAAARVPGSGRGS